MNWPHPFSIEASTSPTSSPTTTAISRYSFIINFPPAPRALLRLSHCDAPAIVLYYADVGYHPLLLQPRNHGKPYQRGENGFDFGAVSFSSMIVNSNRFQLHCLAYNLFNWFRLCSHCPYQDKFRITVNNSGSWLWTLIIYTPPRGKSLTLSLSL